MVRSDQRIVIGVDGGGSGCRAAIFAPGGGLRHSGASGPANYTTNPEAAIWNLLNAVNGACSAGGIDPAMLKNSVAHVGVSGVLRTDQAEEIAAALPFGTCQVTDDRPTVVAGALGGQPGFVLVAGTGTFVARSDGFLAGDTQGMAQFVGGWGLQLGDEASAGWIGRAILSRVLHCEDGLEEHTDLTRRILAMFRQGSAGMVDFARGAEPADYGGFAPEVVDAAASGDRIGQELMRKGAAYLCSALERLDFHEGSVLCVSGGIGPLYVEYLPEHMTRNIIAPFGNALEGAVLLARRLAEQ